MNLPWIKVYAALPRHRKSRELGNILGRKRAWTHVLELWLWASDQCPDGNLHGLSDATVAESAGWTGKPERFVAALRSAGFLDADGQLHDWEEHQPLHVEAAEEKEAESTETPEERRRRLDRIRKQEKRNARRTDADAEADTGGHEADMSAAEADTKRTTADENVSQRVRAKTETKTETETETETTTPVAPSPGAGVGGPSDSPANRQVQAPESTRGAGTLPGVEPAARPAKADVEAQVTEVLEHWQAVCDMPGADITTGTEAGKARRDRVRKRLKGGATVEKLKLAASHVANNSWLSGRKPGSPRDGYRDVQHVFRDALQVDRLARLTAPDDAPRSGSGPPRLPPLTSNHEGENRSEGF